MWSRADAVDTTAHRTPAGPNPSQGDHGAKITAQVAWDSFASISIWESKGSQASVEADIQLAGLDAVSQTRNQYAETANLIASACTDAKNYFCIVDRGDHALLMCLKVFVVHVAWRTCFLLRVI